jgi:WD40 repeat protein
MEDMMTGESPKSDPAQLSPAASGRRAFLRDGMSLVGGTALASVALEMLRHPVPAFGSPRPRIDRPTCLAVASATRVLTCDDGRRVVLWTKHDTSFDRTPFNGNHLNKASYVDVLGTRIVAASFDGKVSVRDLGAPGNMPRTFRQHTDLPIRPAGREVEVWVAVLSEDGMALSGDNFGNILYWDATANNPPIRNGFKDADEWVAGLAFVPGAQTRFLSGHEDGKMILWNITDVDPDPDPAHPNLNPPNLQKHFFRHPSRDLPVNSVAVTDDGSRAISAGFDGTARIWDLTTLAVPPAENTPLHVVEHDDIVWRVSISPKNSKFDTASQDGTVRLFRVADGVEWELAGIPQRAFVDGGGKDRD